MYSSGLFLLPSQAFECLWWTSNTPKRAGFFKRKAENGYVTSCWIRKGSLKTTVHSGNPFKNSFYLYIVIYFFHDLKSYETAWPRTSDLYKGDVCPFCYLSMGSSESFHFDLLFRSEEPEKRKHTQKIQLHHLHRWLMILQANQASV